MPHFPCYTFESVTQMDDSGWDETQGSPATAEALRYGRRLTDKILIAFHHACGTADISTAEDLLGALGRLIARPVAAISYDRRRVVETLADANYRLWDLKRQHVPSPGADAPQPPDVRPIQ